MSNMDTGNESNIEFSIDTNDQSYMTGLSPTLTFRVNMCFNPRNGGRFQQLWFNKEFNKGRWIDVPHVFSSKDTYDPSIDKIITYI